MEEIRLETKVGKDGVLAIPGFLAGEEVEVIIHRKLPTPKKRREGGWAKGWVKIMPGFDDPIPGMEDYM